MASQYKTHNFKQVLQLTEILGWVTYVAVGLGKCTGAKASVVAIVVKSICMSNIAKSTSLSMPVSLI